MILCSTLLLFFHWIALGNGQTATYGSWIEGRSTFYSGIDSGACSYGTISTSSFPYGYIAAVNEDFFDDSQSCGECYEVQCLGDWDGGTDGCCNTDSSSGNNSIVTIEISDLCPESGNTEWCSGDIAHFDLSEAAFSVIGDTNCGVISMRYRRVSCDFSGNVIIESKDGVNAYWYAIFVKNVAGYGRISKVELKDSSDGATWNVGETTEYNGYEFQNDAGWQTPLSVRITDSAGNNITSIDLIANTNAEEEFDFGSNFEVNEDDTGSTTGNSDSDSDSDFGNAIVVNWVLYSLMAFDAWVWLC